MSERGTEALNSRKWLTAREYFRQLVDVYPQSPYRADAKLGIGDTYLGEGTAESFVLGINEFREFLSFYPNHGRADYAQYKLGMAHFYQMRAPERDQTETKEAIQELTTFMQRFGKTSPLANEAAAKLREARDRLSMSEYRVGLHYHRSRWYPGAIERFKTVLERDPQFTNRDAVYFYLGEALEKIQRPAEALPQYDRLIKEFEKSEYLAEAQKRVEAIRAGLEKKLGSLLTPNSQFQLPKISVLEVGSCPPPPVGRRARATSFSEAGRSALNRARAKAGKLGVDRLRPATVRSAALSPVRG